MTKPFQKYKTTSVTSASKEKVLLMMYEGAIKFTKLAAKACDEKKIADKGVFAGRAYDIVMELNNTLDHKIGKDIAMNLEQLYIFIMEEYTKGNISCKAVHFNNALKILENLYQGWIGAIEKLKKESESQGGV